MKLISKSQLVDLFWTAVVSLTLTWLILGPIWEWLFFRDKNRDAPINLKTTTHTIKHKY